MNKLEEAIRNKAVDVLNQSFRIQIIDEFFDAKISSDQLVQLLSVAAAKACMPFIEKAYDSAYFQSANDRSKEVSYYKYADRKEKWLKENIGG